MEVGRRSMGEVPATTHGFAGRGPFTVVGTAGDATVAVFSAGLAPGMDFDLTYTGTFGADIHTGAITATILGRF